MPNHVDPEDAMRPGKDYTAEQLNGLLALLNSNYDLRGGDIDTHPVLGGIRFSEPPAVDTADKWLTDSGPIAEAANVVGEADLAHRLPEGRHRHRGGPLPLLRGRP